MNMIFKIGRQLVKVDHDQGNSSKLAENESGQMVLKILPIARTVKCHKPPGLSSPLSSF